MKKLRHFLELTSTVLASILCAVSFGHGYHHYEAHYRLEKKALGETLAVRRAFPLEFARCEKTYNLDESYCRVDFVKNDPTHLDYATPIPPIKLPNGDQVNIETDERGYAIFYFGSLETKPTQLSQIKEALKILAGNGIKEAVAQLYRPPSNVTPSGYKETKLGQMVGVKRKVPIRYDECVKTFEEESCWVHILDESTADHPGPAGGGDISKTYLFSQDERVTVSLENLYSDYLISYEGPETAKEKILAKIQTALTKLKGNKKELTLECTLFTLRKFILSSSDTLVANAQFFAVEMPLSYSICKDSLDLSNKSCKGDFNQSVSTGNLDHPGGGEILYLDMKPDGVLDIYASYVAGNPFWKLHFETSENTSLTPLEFLSKGFEDLALKGKTSIQSFGFEAR